MMNFDYYLDAARERHDLDTRRRERTRAERKLRRKIKTIASVCVFSVAAVALIFALAGCVEQEGETTPGEQEVQSTIKRTSEAVVVVLESEAPDEDARIEAALLASGYYSSAIPLTYEEQAYLRAACDEFGVDYPLMLAVIEQETNFCNVAGDNGNSIGYCQIQQRWCKDLMAEIGTTDLWVPLDNFRTGCAILAGHMMKYGNLEDALSAYNTGGPSSTKYSAAVLERYEKWEKEVCR